MIQSKTQKIIKDTEGNEVVMERVDKTLKETMEEKPSGRWDPEYWHPDFQELLHSLAIKFQLSPLGDFIDFITYGQVGQRIYDPEGKVRYIQTINMSATGIDYSAKEAWIKEGSHNDPGRSRLKNTDVLLGNAGMGGLGKALIFLDKENQTNISQDIDILRFKKINPYYVTIFLKSIFGNKQIWMRSRGVGAPKLPFDEIKSIKIALLPDSIQKNIEVKYKEMAAYHDKAMQFKKSGNEAEYKKNIETAEKMLKNLIARTEAVIRGERDDII